MKKSTPEKIIEQVKASLLRLNPYKIILFGSYAYGAPDQDSDLDLLVVLQDHRVPETFAERMKLHSIVARQLRSIRQHVPMDVIVHTLPTYENFIQNGGFFMREIETRGKVLYEADHRRMAQAS